MFHTPLELVEMVRIGCIRVSRGLRKIALWKPGWLENNARSLGVPISSSSTRATARCMNGV